MDCVSCQYKKYICSSGHLDCGGIYVYILILLLLICLFSCESMFWVCPPFRMCTMKEKTERPQACQCVPKQGVDAAGECAEEMKKIICVILMQLTKKLSSLSRSLSPPLEPHWSRQDSASWGGWPGSSRLSPTMASSSVGKIWLPLLLGSWCPRN